jgi:hypothetical protein
MAPAPPVLCDFAGSRRVCEPGLLRSSFQGLDKIRAVGYTWIDWSDHLPVNLNFGGLDGQLVRTTTSGSLC